MHRLLVFINATVENPHFGSQTKEEMTTEVLFAPRVFHEQTVEKGH